MKKPNPIITLKSIVSIAATGALLVVMALSPLQALGAKFSRQNPIVLAVGKVSPAVVNISSEYEIRKHPNPFSGFGIDPFFDSFFRDFFDPGGERRYKRQSLGSGVIIDGQRGFILTNEHVIARTGKITVVLQDEREFGAQIVGSDPDSDLAVLRINAKRPLPAIQMGRSDDLMIGETVIAIGNPFGFSNTVTTGVISAVNRSIRTDDRIYQDFIQIDASINPGNSGGPLLNINGELIGINTAIYAKARGIGFAIPINKAKRIISDLIRHGEVIPAWIGLTVQDFDAKLARYLKVPAKGGALIKEVQENAPASQKGIRVGDIILSVGAKRIFSKNDFLVAMKNFASGDTIRFEIWRNEKKHAFSVDAGVFPIALALGLAERRLGITVRDLSFKDRASRKIRVKTGVVIAGLHRQSYLARIGVLPGDVIQQIDEMTINRLEDFKKAIVKYRAKKSLLFLVQRGDQGYYITVKL